MHGTVKYLVVVLVVAVITIVVVVFSGSGCWGGRSRSWCVDTCTHVQVVASASECGKSRSPYVSLRP